MKTTIEQLEKIIADYTPMLFQLKEEQLTAKPNPAKWSKKEIIGHLVDSALTNSRRFVVAQYEDSPHIVYAQNTWVTTSGYQNYASADLINLWSLLNKHICSILANMNSELYSRTCVTGEPHTIEWLAADYNKHLLHHMHVILDLEPIAYP
ncbi:MAG: DinB family protein [Sphingobacteriales bacterium]|nr:DinB family protein [Sphingobacteriales bacterium]MBI3719548.1 DinB family protein [Sphingobacteriales bacterium]